MRKLIVGLMAIMLTAGAFATPRPFEKHDKDLIDKGILDLADDKVIVGNALGKAIAMNNASDGRLVKRVIRATWDFDVDGGDVSAINLGEKIPANALINLAYFYTVAQVVDGGSGTGALSCEDANNLFSAADVTGNAPAVVVDGIPQNGAANMVKAIAADCDLTWTIAGAAATAGKLIFIVEYMIVE